MRRKELSVHILSYPQKGSKAEGLHVPLVKLINRHSRSFASINHRIPLFNIFLTKFSSKTRFSNLIILSYHMFFERVRERPGLNYSSRQERLISGF